MIAAIAGFGLWLFGDSLVGIRLLPALAATATVVVTGALARRLGGGNFAQALAMLALALSPFYLAVGNLLTMNAFEPLLWLAATYVFVTALDRDRPAEWLALGAILGLGLLNKYTMGFFAVSAVAGISLTPSRRAFRRPGLWLAAAVAGAIVAPNLFWQAADGWPQLDVLRHAAAAKNVVVGPVAFYLQQILMMNPLAAPVWIAGLWFVFRDPAARAFRWFGWTYVVLSLVYLALGAKVYYLAPIYPTLFAAGGVLAARFLEARTGATGRTAYATALVLSGLVIAPQAYPLLPLPAFLEYQRVFDVRAIKMERHPAGVVPQNFADMLGWETLVRTMARAYDAVPKAERPGTTILTHDYGQASAIDFLGGRYGLPRALSGHNNYYLYGTRGYSGASLLTVGIDRRDLTPEYRHVVRVATYHDAYLLPDSNDLPVYRCTDPVEPLAAYFPHFKRYI